MASSIFQGAFYPAFLFLLFVFPAMSSYTKLRYIMYLTGQHNVVPEPSLVENITHVALAFMRSETFNVPNQTAWDLFTTVSEVRSKFPNSAKIMVAIGGWGNTDGFSTAAKTAESRDLFAQNVARMVEQTGADGIDIDWEYPGGNGEDYKTHPNSEKAWEIPAYPLLLSQLRTSLGPSKLISAAVPGLPRDMLAFTAASVPQISQSIDFWNIMTYDMFNRRDNVTKHHTGLQLSLQAIDAYLERGVSAEKANLGLAFYTKWYKTDPIANATCAKQPVGCPTALMEDPTTGADLGKVGGFSYHDPVPSDFAPSWTKALANGVYDEIGGGHYYWDADEDLYWSWDTSAAILKKFPDVIEKKRLGGVFAWGLGEDAPEFEHLTTSNEGVAEWLGNGKEEQGKREFERTLC
ncbi:42 kDa endochitinase-like protein [Byssothecium circinans]|uniref:chitinase n=1 Tax=Byssothecium circinans TaxID=147558 RepID=A0A6A5U2S8_9PLEO|nr:42 kDa endochitinase-like protein [Byssothecium circinans]